MRGGLNSSTEEAQLQKRIIDLCKELDLLVFHSGDPRRDTGGGFPDLVIVSREGDGVIFAELKKWDGRLSPKQTEWKWALKANGEAHRFWRPGDWAQIETELRMIA